MTPIIITTKKNGLPLMIHTRKHCLFATTALAAALLVNGAQAADLQEAIVEHSAVEDEIVEKGAVHPGIIEKGAIDPNAHGDCTDDGCEGPQMRGKMYDNGSVGRLPITPNLEQETAADYAPVPFRISVDGQMVDESGQVVNAGAFGSDPSDPNVFKQRKTDVDLNAVDIQLKFDGLEIKPLLNVSTVPIRRAYAAGETVSFLATSNYTAFIQRAEIRIYKAEDPTNCIAALPISLTGVADWTMPSGGSGEFLYTVRVYDDADRFDETIPLSLIRSDSMLHTHEVDAIAPGMAEDRTAFRNIPLHGGAVTVHGKNVPAGYGITVFDEPIPVDPHGAFVVQRILPPGDHVVDIAVNGPMKAGGLYFSRDVNIPSSEWFYVALAEATIGKQSGDPGIEDVREGEFDKIYKKGRVAFYLKGKVKGNVLITAAADTGENDLKSLFKDMDARSAREFLKRIDPDKYYPVYGDDSTWVEDAPTRGKFYVRVERGDSHIMWGNYKTHITGTKFLASSRGLYGANVVVRSDSQTTFGERKTEITGYGALPDTVPQTDEFLGTGGSAYFLRRQDITVGSETVMVEVRDGVSGRVVDRKYLVHGEDYTFDHIQGVIILRRPLASSTLGLGPVRSGALGGEKQYLLVSYEYIPRARDTKDYVYGGRVQQWIGNSVRIGLTGNIDKVNQESHKAMGADILVRRSESTYLEGEVARSSGTASTLSHSTDGGMTITEGAGTSGRSALGWRIGGQVDLSDVRRLGVNAGKIGGYYERKAAGFSSLTERLDASRRVWGAHAAVPITSTINFGAAIDDLKDGNGQKRRETEFVSSWQFLPQWKATVGLTATDIHSPTALAAGKRGYDGNRADLGLRIDFLQNEDYSYYAFGQYSVLRRGDIDKNDRAGLGAEIRLTEKLTAEGEVSYGRSGIGGLAGINYARTVDDQYYMGYRLDPSRAFDLTRSEVLDGRDLGSLVAGVRKRIDDVTSAYAESNYDIFGRRQSLAQTYGVLYTPNALWTVDLSAEAGRIMDSRINPATNLEYADFNRYAGSAAVGYNDEEMGLSGRTRGEIRVENSDDKTRNVNTYALSAAAAWQHDESGRLLVNADAVLSQAQAGRYYSGDYIEGSLGYAYRPVDNDRLNALMRYTFLYDLPTLGQIASASAPGMPGPMQRSHIVSADVTYDVLPWLSIGGKYGARIGQISVRDDGAKGFGQWQTSSAHLGILRTDLHVVKNWDALLEARAFLTPAVKSVDYGFLAALYRHVGNNFKVGAGYNFGRFSDDLRDLTLDDKGPFLNIVGKF
jgi:hypothetical protein